MLIKDIYQSAAGGQRLKPVQQQRIAWVMRDIRFQQWFSTNTSEMLVVDGMEPSGNTAETSPLTFLDVLLTMTIEDLPGAVSIKFFCGLHAKPEDNLEGAQGIIRSFLFQLLIQPWTFDCGFIDENFLSQIKNYDLCQLCGLFRDLVTSAPDNTTVFCIIDGISWFENDDRRDGICTVMASLRDMVNELRWENQEGILVDLKLLVTSPVASRSANEWCDPYFRLFMPRDTGGNGQTFNIMHMNAYAHRLINETQQDESDSWAVATRSVYESNVL